MNEKFDIDEAKDLWNDPAPELSREQLSRAYGHVSGFIRQRRIRKGVRIGLTCCAAAVVFIATGLAGGLIGRNTLSQQEPASFVEYVAPTGQTKVLTLSDGTTVHLNSQSRLCCSNKFDGKTREVFLCGEGFFEVAKDTEHPFIVHAAGNSIKVTGTKFNVRAFLDENVCTTTLLEGGVEVGVPGQNNPITLTPGHALTISGNNNDINLFKIDAHSAIGWYKGEFNAYNKTLDQICHDLERRFNVRIMIADETIASRTYYASFVNNEDADGILKALNIQKDFRIKKQDNYYYIY